MPLPEFDGSVGHSFGLEVDDVVIRDVIEVSGLTMEQDVIELKQNNAAGGYVIKRLPGRWKAGQCSLTRGVSPDDGFQKWIMDSQAAQSGDVRKRSSIIVYDSEGQEVRRYRLVNAWPKSLEFSTLKAGDTSVLTEKLVLIYEQLGVD
jgi:phage tail-like protein